MSTFHAVTPQDSQAIVNDQIKLFFLRRGAANFPGDLAEKIARLNVKEIVWMCQSESEGNISLTCLYR